MSTYLFTFVLFTEMARLIIIIDFNSSPVGIQQDLWNDRTGAYARQWVTLYDCQKNAGKHLQRKCCHCNFLLQVRYMLTIWYD